MIQLADAIATLPPDACARVRERLAPRAERWMVEAHRAARFWLTYHSVCMEMYALGPLPSHWPEPGPELMTAACEAMPIAAPGGARERTDDLVAPCPPVPDSCVRTSPP